MLRTILAAVVFSLLCRATPIFAAQSCEDWCENRAFNFNFVPKKGSLDDSTSTFGRKAYPARVQVREISGLPGLFAEPLALSFRGPLVCFCSRVRPMTRPVKGPPVAFLIPARGHREKR